MALLHERGVAVDFIPISLMEPRPGQRTAVFERLASSLREHPGFVRYRMGSESMYKHAPPLRCPSGETFHRVIVSQANI